MSSNNVHKQEFDIIRLPHEAFTEDRGYKVCADPKLVLADTEDTAQWKNDVTGVAIIADSVTIELEDSTGSVELAQGFEVAFPFQHNAAGFVIDWRSNLIAYGAGCYRVKVNYDINGFIGFYYAGHYELMPYSVTSSESTVQIIANYNDSVKKDGINYTGSGFYTGIRVHGFFGNEQLNSEHRSLLKANDVRVKVRNFSAPSYDFVTRPLTRCFTRPLKEILLNASDIWISDYNAWNHEQYRFFNVILADSEGVELEGDETFVRQINATFVDKTWITESKFDQQAAQPPSLSELVSTTCSVANYTVQYEDGTLIESGTIQSGGSKLIEVPTGGVEPTTLWIFLIANFSIDPEQVATINVGKVFKYTLEGVERFRLVPEPYDPTEDSFFEEFDGTTLTNLIIKRV